MIGTRAMSGSAAIRFRKRAIAAFESSIASSMLMSMTCAPFSTCWRATASASSYWPLRIRRAKALEPVTLVRSPTLTNSESSPMFSGSRPDRRSLRSDLPAPRAAATPSPPRAIARMCSGVVPQQPPAMLTKPASANSFSSDEVIVRRLVEAGLAHRIGQAGVRIDADEGVADPRQLRDVRPHQRRAERAVEADRERLRMAHRIPERLDGLAGQGAAGGVGDGAGNHHRQALARSPRRTGRSRTARPWRSACRRWSRPASRSTPPSTSARACSR